MIWAMAEFVDDAEFDRLFREFEALGGKAQWCVPEDWERLYRQQATCPHGLRLMTCKKCRRPISTGRDS